VLFYREDKRSLKPMNQLWDGVERFVSLAPRPTRTVRLVSVRDFRSGNLVEESAEVEADGQEKVDWLARSARSLCMTEGVHILVMWRPEFGGSEIPAEMMPVSPQVKLAHQSQHSAWLFLYFSVNFEVGSKAFSEFVAAASAALPVKLLPQNWRELRPTRAGTFKLNRVAVAGA
jgi:hypothetical protein